MFKTINQVTVFLIELIMVWSFAYFGFQKGYSIIVKYLLAFILPVFVVLLWGYYAAPKSSHRLEMPNLILFRLALFLIASSLLYRCNQTNMAIGVALLSFATQIAGYFLND